jgi:outer membrane immunogenic protein
MKKLIAAAGVLVMSVGMASAADMRMPVKAPPIVDPPFSWSGFYLGGNLGYSWGRASTDQTDTTTSQTTVRAFRNDTGAEVAAVPGFPGIAFPVVGPLTSATSGTSGKAKVDGIVGGVQGGYNWQFDRSWVIGIEADFQGSGERGSLTTCTGTCVSGSAFGSASTRLDWYGSVRGRLGFLPHERVFLYGTGGFAYGHLRTDYTTGFIGQPLLAGSTTSNRPGWIVGAGAEGAIDRHWTVRAEYFYMDLGRVGTNLGTGTTSTVVGPIIVGDGRFNLLSTTTNTVTGAASTKFVDHIARVAFNYRF